MVIEVLIPQIGRARIAEENVRRKAAAGITATDCAAIRRATAMTLV